MKKAIYFTDKELELISEGLSIFMDDLSCPTEDDISGADSINKKIYKENQDRLNK